MDHYDDTVDIPQAEYEAMKSFAQQVQAEREFAQVAQYTVQQEQAYRQQAEDYDQAVNHFREKVAEQIKVAFNVDEQQAQQQANDYLRSVAIDSAKRGMNPADVAYNLARTYGYKTPTKLDADIEEYNDYHKAVRSDLDSIVPGGADDDLDQVWAEMEKQEYGTE